MTFLIYGATKGKGSGIGRSVALLLQGKGHKVHGLCRDEAKARAESEFPLEALDIRTKEGADRLLELVRTLDPDVIWSACGAGHGEPLWTLPEQAMEEMIDANIRNNILFCKICAPSCIDGGPHLILTASVAGTLVGEGAAVYAGTKGFLTPFVRGQRAEYGRQGHNAKISLLLLHSARLTGLEVIADAVEFIGRQSRAMELLIN